MEFELTEEQVLLSDSVQRFTDNEYPFAKRQRLAKRERGFSDEHWQRFAELGWLALPFVEQDGGLAGGAVEITLLMEKLGASLVVEPYVPSIVLSGGAIKHAASAAQRAHWLPGIIEGTSQAALGFVEKQSRFELENIETTAFKDGNGYVLNGAKSVVFNGPAADILVVAARTGGESRDPDGISLFVVDAYTQGLNRRDYSTVDGLRASELTLDNVRVAGDALLGDTGSGLAALERTIDDGIVAVCAEAVGCMEALYKRTVEYCKSRTQFGQPIGKFQVLQHRMVDMFMAYEQCKSLMYVTAMRMDVGYGKEAQKAASAFKAQIGDAAKFVGQSAIQLHGGMGMTDHLDIGHYFKRLTAISTLFGDTDFHRRRYGRL